MNLLFEKCEAFVSVSGLFVMGMGYGGFILAQTKTVVAWLLKTSESVQLASNGEELLS